jgi:MerR family transcriptional regulator, copper efflux regulator
MMTIGVLSRRTGVSVKALREYEGMGLIYTVGRSPGNYRLFGEEALWCIGMVGVLRGLGLTLAEIQELAGMYLQPSDEPIGPRLAKVLGVVRNRTEARVADLQSLLQRIEDFEVGHEAELGGRTDFELQDPRSHAGGLTLTLGGDRSFEG